MELFAPIPLLVIGFVIYYVHQVTSDKRVLQVVAGALIARSDLSAARGDQKEADRLREQWHALLRAQASVSASPSFPLEDSEQRVLSMLTSPWELEKLMMGYGSHLEAYSSLSRLAQKTDKIRRAKRQ